MNIYNLLEIGGLCLFLFGFVIFVIFIIFFEYSEFSDIVLKTTMALMFIVAIFLIIGLLLNPNDSKNSDDYPVFIPIFIGR